MNYGIIYARNSKRDNGNKLPDCILARQNLNSNSVYDVSGVCVGGVLHQSESRESKSPGAFGDNGGF